MHHDSSSPCETDPTERKVMKTPRASMHANPPAVVSQTWSMSTHSRMASVFLNLVLPSVRSPLLLSTATRFALLCHYLHLMLTPASLYQDVGKKPLGKEPVETNLKRKSSSVGNGPQRVPVRTSRPTTTQTTTTRPRPTLPLRATAISNEPVFEIARDDLEDSRQVNRVPTLSSSPLTLTSRQPTSPSFRYHLPGPSRKGYEEGPEGLSESSQSR